MTTHRSFRPVTATLIWLVMALCLAGARTAGPARAAGAETGMILADPTGKILYGKNPDAALVPASTLKVLTALAALETLGKGFRFSTMVYIGETGQLTLRGTGDPLFTSREIRQMAGELARILRARGSGTGYHIVVDGSAFAPRLEVPGTGQSLNPYDADIGALSANFNTICFARDARGNYFSPEPETPLVEFARRVAARSPLENGRIPLPAGQGAIYTGHLMAAFLRQEGIWINGTITPGIPGPGDRQVLAWHSPHTLEAVVRQMLRYSSNFMANQLFVTLGGRERGRPATLEKGRQAVVQKARELDIAPVHVAEGSGISRENRISPRGMLGVLQAFAPYHDLMRRDNGVYYKTGTLKNVRTLCGYISGPGRGLFPFAIMVNGDEPSLEGYLETLRDRVGG